MPKQAMGAVRAGGRRRSCLNAVRCRCDVAQHVMKPMVRSRPNRMVWRLIGHCLLLGGIVAVLCLLFLALSGHSREFYRRMACRSNLVSLGVALDQYSADYGEVYPWRIGASDPPQAWRDLGLLYPRYCAQPREFLCPSSGDIDVPARTTAIEEDCPFDPASGNRAISYAYSYDSSTDTPVPWTSLAGQSTRVLADKAAGRPTSGESAATTNHGRAGRNVLYVGRWVEWEPENEAMHRRVEWVPGSAALDPDPTSDKTGSPAAGNYTDWWSDPPPASD